MEKRLTIAEIGSTSSIGIGAPLAVLEPEQTAQRHEALGLAVDGSGVLAEHVVATRARGVLQPEHRLGVEQVRLALATPLVLAADVEPLVGQRETVRRVGDRVTLRHLLGDDVEADAAELRGGADEVVVDDVLRRGRSPRRPARRSRS